MKISNHLKKRKLNLTKETQLQTNTQMENHQNDQKVRFN